MPKKRLSVIVTKTGDKGKTSLIGGKRVSKASVRVDAYGTIDELNAFLGWVRSEIKDADLSSIIKEIQTDLFILGTDLAAPLNIKVPRIKNSHIERLESLISKYLKGLPPLKEFLLPGGSKGSTILHLARVVTRRAERKVAALPKKELNPLVLIYLNRLSDLLFILGRVAQIRSGEPEEMVKMPLREEEEE